MREQLQGYVADASDSRYQSIVLEGKRLASETEQVEPVVDIYENYWADLSRMKNGFLPCFSSSTCFYSFSQD